MSSWGVADDAKQKAIEKDRKSLEGTWRIIALKINGNDAKEEDAKKLTVVARKDGTWTLYSEGQEVSKGAGVLDPTKKPKTLDFTPSEGGGKDVTYLAIYETGEKTRRLCFVAPGKERPTEFSSKPGSDHILVTFEREKAKE